MDLKEEALRKLRAKRAKESSLEMAYRIYKLRMMDNPNTLSFEDYKKLNERED